MCAVILEPIFLIIHCIQCLQAMFELLECTIDCVCIVALLQKASKCHDFHCKQLVCHGILLLVTTWNREDILLDLFLVARQCHYATE